MIKLIEHKLQLKESRVLPQDGIFWVIDGKFIQSSFDFNPLTQLAIIDNNYYTHKELWHILKDKYKVDGKDVAYDYFPRGRVVINYSDGKFIATIYMDNCLRPEWEDIAKEQFNLNLPSCEVVFGGNSGFGNSHYTCHNCKDKGINK